MWCTNIKLRFPRPDMTIFSHRCHLPDPCPGPPPTSQLPGRGAGVRGKLWNKKKAGREWGTTPRRVGRPVVGSDSCPQSHLGAHFRDTLCILQAAFFMSSSCGRTAGVPRLTPLWADGGRDLPGSHLFHAAPGVARALLLVPCRPLPHPMNWLLLPLSPLTAFVRLRVACRCIRGNSQREESLPPLLEGELKLAIRPAFQARSLTPVSPTRARPPWTPLCRPTPGSAVLTTALLGPQTVSWHLCPPSARWMLATRGVCRPKNMSWLPAVCRKKSKLVDLAHEDLVGGFQTVFLAPALPTPTPRGGHGAGASAAWIAHWALSPPPVSLQTPFLHSSFKTHLKHHLLHGESGPPSE